MARSKPHRNYMGDFAVYKGDTFLNVGTRDEMADFLGLTPGAFIRESSPSWQKRNHGNNHLIIIRIGEDPEKGA